MKSVVWGYAWVKRRVSEMPFVRRRKLWRKIAVAAANERYHRSRMEDYRLQKIELIKEYDALRGKTTEAWLDGK